MVFTLGDDWDQFGVDDEVVFDSAADFGEAKRPSIRDEIAKVSSRLLSKSAEDTFLDICCMLIVEGPLDQSRSASAASGDSFFAQSRPLVETVSSNASAFDRPNLSNDHFKAALVGTNDSMPISSVGSMDNKKLGKRRMSVGESLINGLSLVVFDTSPSQVSGSGDGEQSVSSGFDSEQEPGSPLVQNAIVFSSQISLNDLFRERRGGVRRTLTTEEADMFEGFEEQTVE